MLKDLKDVATKVGDKECRNILQEEIDVAYSEYNPRVYKRRYRSRGGFGDPNMIRCEVRDSRNGINLSLTNEARAVGVDEGERLDEIIEEGKYNYKPSPSKRPVFKRANRTLEKRLGYIEDKIISNMKKKGY